MSIDRRRRSHKRLQFLIASLLSRGWIVRMGETGLIKYRRPGKVGRSEASTSCDSKRGKNK